MKMDMSMGSTHAKKGAMSMAMGSAKGGHPELMAGMGKAMAEMTKASKIKDPDLAAISCILAHHEGMIDMCKFEIANGKIPKAVKFAQMLHDQQEGQITEMKSMIAQMKKDGLEKSK